MADRRSRRRGGQSPITAARRRSLHTSTRWSGHPLYLRTGTAYLPSLPVRRMAAISPKSPNRPCWLQIRLSIRSRVQESNWSRLLLWGDLHSDNRFVLKAITTESAAQRSPASLPNVHDSVQEGLV